MTFWARDTSAGIYNIVRFVTRREGPSKPKKFRSRLLREATRQGLGARRPTSATRQLLCGAYHSPPMRVAEGHARMRPVSTGLPCPPSSKFQRQASRHAEGGALARGRRPLCFAGCCAVDTIPRSSVPQKPVPARPVLEPVCLVLSLPSSRVGASKRSLVGSLARAGRLPRRAFCCAGHTMPLSSLWPKPAPWCPCFCGLCSCKGGPFFSLPSRPEGGGACQVATHGGQIAL